jgi:FKBP-type peptidyl-prolyl cis-trans isomerase 2
MKVKKGDIVKVEYKGTLNDGTVFDSSERHGKPIEFKVGAGEVIPGFDDAVVGMENGEEKQVKLKPAEAYGEPDPHLIKEIPKDKIPKEEEVKKGSLLVASLPDGERVTLHVVDVKEDCIAIDMNHPLAGQELNFMIKVVESSS